MTSSRQHLRDRVESGATVWFAGAQDALSALLVDQSDFDGVFTMSGDLHNSVTLMLAFTGNTQAGPNNTVVRVPGTTHITGTAVSDYGTYNVDVTR